MQQLMLAAHAEGLGTCWVAWFEEATAREACQVPLPYRVVALTPLGVPCLLYTSEPLQREELCPGCRPGAD